MTKVVEQHIRLCAALLVNGRVRIEILEYAVTKSLLRELVQIDLDAFDGNAGRFACREVNTRQWQSDWKCSCEPSNCL